MTVLTAPFEPAFMQRALLEVLAIAVPSGLVGTWVVLRRLAFFSHAAGAATFPGLVVGVGLGFSPWLFALGSVAAFAVSQAASERASRIESGAVTGVLLAAWLAAGAVLTSNVFHSDGRVDGLLFGSLLGVAPIDVARGVIVATATVVVLALAGRGLLACSFAPAAAAALGYRRGAYDALLFTLLAVIVVSSAAAVGGFVVSGLLVVPAATARLLVARLAAIQALAVALAAVEGTAGLWLAYRADLPPGAAIAVLSTAVYLAVAILRAAQRGLPLEPAAEVA